MVAPWVAKVGTWQANSAPESRSRAVNVGRILPIGSRPPAMGIDTSLGKETTRSNGYEVNSPPSST